MDTLLPALAALAPSVGVGLIFWFVIRAVIHADRREREAIARLEAQDRARAPRAERRDAAASVD